VTSYDDWKCTPPDFCDTEPECDECGELVSQCDDGCPRVLFTERLRREQLARIAAAAAKETDDGDICF
jgi:hypothetical protein